MGHIKYVMRQLVDVERNFTLSQKSALKSTGKSLKTLEKSLNSTIFCRTKHC